MNTLITVVMIDSRSDNHPDWVQTAIDSVKRQIYPVEIIVVNNVGRKHTIGQCWNKAVKEAQTKWILFLGDDDWLSPDYTQLLAYYAQRDDLKHAVSFTTNMTVFREDEGQQTLTRPCTGMWWRDYLLQYPFNEKLQKGIDREYIEEVEKRGDTKIMIHYHAGYHYRQHDDYSCAGKISFRVESGDIYINSRYPIHTALIAERLKKHHSLSIDNHPFIPSSAHGAQVLWADWGNEEAVKIGNYDTEASKILRIHAYEVFTSMLHHIPFDRFNKVVFVAPHILDYAERVLQRKIPNAVVIPNVVDMDAFVPPVNKAVNNKVCYAGELSRKKGIQLLLQAARHFPAFDFHIAGKFNEPDIAEYFYKMKPDNVYLEPFSYDLNQFFKDKTYFILPSPREGCPVTPLQAMSAGVIPLIYEHVGAKEYFDGYTWQTFEELNALLERPDLRHWVRQRIAQRHNVDTVARQWKEIVDECIADRVPNAS